MTLNVYSRRKATRLGKSMLFLFGALVSALLIPAQECDQDACARYFKSPVPGEIPPVNYTAGPVTLNAGVEFFSDFGTEGVFFSALLGCGDCEWAAYDNILLREPLKPDPGCGSTGFLRGDTFFSQIPDRFLKMYMI